MGVVRHIHWAYQGTVNRIVTTSAAGNTIGSLQWGVFFIKVTTYLSLLPMVLAVRKVGNQHPRRY